MRASGSDRSNFDNFERLIEDSRKHGYYGVSTVKTE
jgi:hypothetical protein